MILLLAKNKQLLIQIQESIVKDDFLLANTTAILLINLIILILCS